MSGSELDAIMEAARRAQSEAATWDQQRVDDVVAAVGWSSYQPTVARELAEATVTETGMGDVEQLVEIHRRRVLGAMAGVHGQASVGEIDRDAERGLTVLARPMGVIALAAPATAPSSGIACNIVHMLKARNAVIVTPNPGALQTAARTVEIARIALVDVGAPPDLLQCLVPTDRARSEALMGAADFVVAAGGAATVRRAYSSGTPAIGAGVGNPTALVDETADVAAAARLVLRGAAFNHGTSCSSESNAIVHRSVHGQFVRTLRDGGAHVCTAQEAALLRVAMWREGHPDRELAGRSACHIAHAAGFAVPPEAAVLVLEVEDHTAAGDPRFGEKLAPILSVAAYDDFDRAVELIVQIGVHAGRGHSCSIHTQREDRPRQVAERVEFVRVLVNQSTAVGNSGSFDNGLPFTSTVTSGTWGGCSHSENITFRHFLNQIWISESREAAVPDEATIFGRHCTAVAPG